MKWFQQYKGGGWDYRRASLHSVDHQITGSIVFTKGSCIPWLQRILVRLFSLEKHPQDLRPEARSLLVELLTDARVNWRSIFSWVGGWKIKSFVPKKLSIPLQSQRTWGQHKISNDELDFNPIDSWFVLSFLFCKYAGRLISREVNYLPA
jgi:hypothetical protein